MSSKKIERHYKVKGPSQSFNRLLKFCDDLEVAADSLALLAQGSDITIHSEKVHDAIGAFQHQISQKPFMALVLLWASEIDTHLAFGERCVGCILDLIKHNILPFEHTKSHQLLRIAEIQLADHAEIFDAIRSHKEWPLDKQEEYVLIYQDFANALSEMSYGLILKPFDHDRSITSWNFFTCFS